MPKVLDLYLRVLRGGFFIDAIYINKHNYLVTKIQLF